jgi:hypothetical protein
LAGHGQVEQAGGVDQVVVAVVAQVDAAGEAIRVPLGSPVALGNGGGLITLLDPDRLKVDGVAYTKAQAEREGWSLVF